MVYNLHLFASNGKVLRTKMLYFLQYNNQTSLAK